MQQNKMNPSVFAEPLLEILRCLKCQGNLAPTPEAFVCDGCGQKYPIVNGVARFVDEQNYAGSFGFQWKLYSQTQLDDANSRRSEDAFRRRTGFLRYAGYKRVGIPCGSGVTEAGCKTIYTQRLKLSGMRWTTAGAQVILDLRVVNLSGVWDAAYRRLLNAHPDINIPPYAAGARNGPEVAALGEPV